MVYDIFEKEAAVLEAGKKCLENGSIEGEEGLRRFRELLKSYEKLFRMTRRLVRMSDRNEAELNALAKSLEEKNTILHSLSTKLAKYLPRQVFESIFSGERDVSLATERKKLTVFFSDIKDFTATTEELEPEDLTFLLNDYFTEMSSIALEYGATIDKFIGDAMLIFFGDPESRGVKEDALACVKMALAMQRRMQELRRKWRDFGYRRPFHMRIGINTGYCNVGNFGSSERIDYTIIGPEVNKAARLESISEADGIALAYETYALVRHHVLADEGQPIPVKGIARPIKPFLVRGVVGDVVADDRIIREEGDRLQLQVNLEGLGVEARSAIAERLESIAHRIRQP